MSAEEQVKLLKQELESLKSIIINREKEAEKATQNTEAIEKELKKLLKGEKKESGEVGDRVVYVAQSRKLDKFKGRPEKTTDPGVEEWIEDAKAACQSKGLGSKDQAAYLIEHLGGNARREVLGRGEAVSRDPSQIFAVLLRVFGDGDSLPQQQQQFYSYRQKEGEDLVSCSLALVKIFDRIVQLDPSFLPGRDTQLKNRLAEAVLDQSLRTELRRLNAEHPELPFFDARDRVIKLTNSQNKPLVKEATVREVAIDKDLQKIVEQQTAQIAAQQKQIESLITAMKNLEPRDGQKKTRKCWLCDSTGHIKRNCPKNSERSATVTGQQEIRKPNLNC